jgi:VIT1/CCC1 family predicted Fe2+/Mn2+ transporter
MGSDSRYRRRLAAERDAAAVYRGIASRRTGEERDVLLALAEAEDRHADYWAGLLDGSAPAPEPPRLRGLRARALAWLAGRVGSLLTLALVQRAELRTTYERDADAPAVMGAEEQVHARVVEGLARRQRAQVSGVVRAAVFGVNDGLVSNLSLVLGVAGAAQSTRTLLLTGLAGLLSGALSMGAGEYVSVRSQRELLDTALPPLDRSALDALRRGDSRDLSLAFRAEGASAAEADRRADALLASPHDPAHQLGSVKGSVDVVGSALTAASLSFLAFAAGAAVPILPFLVLGGTAALWTGAALAGAGLFVVGAAAAVLAGGPPLARGMRQLLIGAAAAAITYNLGRLFGVALA